MKEQKAQGTIRKKKILKNSAGRSSRESRLLAAPQKPDEKDQANSARARRLNPIRVLHLGIVYKFSKYEGERRGTAGTEIGWMKFVEYVQALLFFIFNTFVTEP